jgi:hypothetical protein
MKGRNSFVSPSLDRVRRRVKEKYGWSTLTQADNYIALKFEEMERNKSLFYGEPDQQQKGKKKKGAVDIAHDILYGGGFA